MNFSFMKVQPKYTVIMVSKTKNAIRTTVIFFTIHATIAYTTNLMIANPAFLIATDLAFPMETCKYCSETFRLANSGLNAISQKKPESIGLLKYFTKLFDKAMISSPAITPVII